MIGKSKQIINDEIGLVQLCVKYLLEQLNKKEGYTFKLTLGQIELYGEII